MSFGVYSFGSNRSGQLGVGHKEDLSSPAPCLFRETSSLGLTSWIQNDTVTKITAGGNHTLLLTRSGVVYAAGNNENGRCGFKNGLTQSASFECVDLSLLPDSAQSSAKITDIAATWEASLLVVDGRHVYACGSGSKGELGLGSEKQEAPQMVKVFGLDSSTNHDASIVHISASVNHIVLLTSTGVMYGWGSCRKGQLGGGTKSQQVLWRPRIIEAPFIPRQLVTGRGFTFLLGRDSDQILFGEIQEAQSLPLELAHDEDVICSGWSTVYGLSRGHVQGIGRNDRGQRPPNKLPAIRQLAAGSEHCLGLTTSGDVVAWGWGEHGNCGVPVDHRGNVVDRWNHIVLPLAHPATVDRVEAGCATSFVVVLQDRTPGSEDGAEI